MKNVMIDSSSGETYELVWPDGFCIQTILCDTLAQGIRNGKL